MKDLLLDLTERYTLPICMAIITVIGLVQPWLPTEFKTAIRALIGV